ncbi:hypothetical protein U3A58_17230 [Algoriphagus sp. C2-6-M1]|uniref:hypothetical protein n=1 Tax=Algoriphagus persicinus TaxID=3108754 RepID=UPI002B38094B|nr:hypothetical protein [Algoriphagus sp. C2-6-M1]MEB2782138.1 hypothetical protein [Algoriphagus sp. C2-6-M1]
MEQPQLLVIAGCNGAGKSSYSRILSPEGIVVFDYAGTDFTILFLLTWKSIYSFVNKDSWD